MQRYLARRIYYGWVVTGITAMTILIAAGIRSAPAVLIHPLEDDLGWSRATISFAASIGLVIYGLSSPLSGSLMDRAGPRRLMLIGVAVAGGSIILSASMTQVWQLHLFWGLLSGVGTGLAAAVLGATVATRWFAAHRGLVIGILGAATSAGQLVFVPLLMWLVVEIGWRGSVVALGVLALSLLLPILLLMRDDPAQIGLRPLGAPPVTATSAPLIAPNNRVLAQALRVPEFWLLAGSFFICGATSNGIIGTHLIPHSIDIGISEVTAASVIGVMGAMNFAGTITSGWLTDRYDPRKLLAFYYTFRGLSLFLLPFMDSILGLIVFAVVFGLDYIATVPPTVALSADIFGRQNVGKIYGWVFLSHQLGAGMAAYFGGLSRDLLGDYQLAFLASGLLAIIGGAMALRIKRTPAPALQPEPTTVRA